MKSKQMDFWKRQTIRRFEQILYILFIFLLHLLKFVFFSHIAMSTSKILAKSLKKEAIIYAH